MCYSEKQGWFCFSEHQRSEGCTHLVTSWLQHIKNQKGSLCNCLRFFTVMGALNRLSFGRRAWGWLGSFRDMNTRPSATGIHISWLQISTVKMWWWSYFYLSPSRKKKKKKLRSTHVLLWEQQTLFVAFFFFFLWRKLRLENLTEDGIWAVRSLSKKQKVHTILCDSWRNCKSRWNQWKPFFCKQFQSCRHWGTW